MKAALAPVFSQRDDNTGDEERGGNYIWSRKRLIKPVKHAGGGQTSCRGAY